MTESKHLTPERLKVIGETAGAVGAKVSDGTIPMKFYEKMLGQNPELLAYFNISHHLSNEGLMRKLRIDQPTAEMLKQHLNQPAAFGQSLFEPQETQEEVLAKSVLAAVGHLQNLEEISGPLQRIVHRHCALGILPHHYSYVHDNFLAATAEVLGDAVTPEVADAWSGALLHVSESLIAQEKALYDQVTARQHNWDAREPAEFVVRDVKRAAKNMTSLYLERADGAPPPWYQPGQHITLCENPTNMQYFAPRHYTIAAPAPIGNAIRICVRHLQGSDTTPAGVMSTFINTALKVGDIVKLRPPFGVFTVDLASPFEQVAWVTAGAGITTAIAMSETMARAGKRVVHWHSDRDEASVAHADELSKAPLDASLRYYDGAQAFSVERLMEQLVGAGVEVRDPKTGVFICAPPAMMLTVRNGLQKKGVPLDRILYEAYGPLAS
jgi:nitric oxide dioxygenase